MKSSRSASTRNIRRTRRLQSESSDDSENQDSSNMDSARAEKFTIRRYQKPLSSPKFGSKLNTSTLSSNIDESDHIQADRTYFRISSSSDTESSQEIYHNGETNDSKNTSSSMNKSSLFELPKNNFNKYRNKIQSSNDDQSKTNDNIQNNNSVSVIVDTDDSVLEEVVNKSIQSSKGNTSIDESFFITSTKVKNKQRIISDSSDNSDVKHIETDDSVLEEIIDESIQSFTGNITNESFFITSSKIKNKQRIISDSSDDSDDGQTPSNNYVCKEESQIMVSESDDDIVNSPPRNIQQIIKTPTQVKYYESQSEMKLNDLSLIEPSESDNNTSDSYKSTISSYQSRPIFDKLNDSNFISTSHIPLGESTVLENSDFKVNGRNLSPKKNIDVITVNDNFKPPRLLNPHLIDLTKDTFDSHASLKLIPNSNPLTIDEFKSLNMEKKRLEEVISLFTQNIETMKNTIKSLNLKLLPDGGSKLKNAILKDEKKLKESQMQLKNLLGKLKKFPEESILTSSASSDFPKPLVINPLIKKAAANIDIGAMGNKALSTYRAQQAMTLDVLHSLHKSLDTCPSSNILADDPRGLKVDLMPHQKHAIAWLMWRERQKPHGGILADDMGLGKTLTMIALVLKSSELEDKVDENIDSEDSIQDLDSDDSARNSIQNTIKGGTLIICPSSLISQWENEIKSKLYPRLLNVVQHYGPNRENSARKLAKNNIVITTYNLVMRDQKMHVNTSPLFQIKWKRIILDEAHIIRNYKSQTSVAVSELSGTNRWALSGTPIHNKEADFYALLKFIKCRPFDEWAVWKRWVGNNDDAGKNRLALLVKTLMLRRTKDELSKGTSFKLPIKNVHIVNVEFAKEEKEAYEKVLLFSSTLFASYLYEKAEKENAIDQGFPIKNKNKNIHQQYSNKDIFQDHPELDKLFKQLNDNNNIQAHHILVLILRLRQLCCHPCLMKNMLETESLKIDGIQDGDDLELVDTMSRMSIGVPVVEKQPLTMTNPIFKDSWVSSKIKSVCAMIKEKVLNTEDKAVIVSQWPSMLLLIDKQLGKYQVKTAMFSGAIPVLKRNKIVDEFNNSKNGPKILLLSLTAGGVGLNLVAANHLFLVDIHWNPQLEAQACDRIYRVGQLKPVNVYKFICTNSIETSIQTIQSHKLELANNVFGGYSNVEGTKITLDDLKQIFQINLPNKAN